MAQDKTVRTAELRRKLIAAGVLLPLGAAFGRASHAQSLPLTPECRGRSEVTPAQGEGPFYLPDTPKRSNLIEPGAKGTRLVLVGLVVSRTCQPVKGALLDIWHCDEQGEYDNKGHRYRGHQFTDEAGRYRFETIVPGDYPGRTRHIHVKVQAPGQRVLTTQIYFPEAPGNRRDGGYRKELEVRPAGGASRFDFVVNA